MATKDGDFLLDGKAYRLTAGGYSIDESVRTRPAPANQPRSLSTFEHQDNYIYFGEGKFLGMGFPAWQGDGPFDIGYGMTMDPEGTLGVADTMVIGVADAVNVDGYVGFRIGYGGGTGPDAAGDRVVFMGKTDGKSIRWRTTGGWTGPTATAISTAGKKAVSHGFFSRITLVGDNDGKVWSTNDGVTYVDLGRPDPSVAGLNTYILGSFKGQLYVSFGTGATNNNSLWRMNSDLSWEISPDGPFLIAGVLDMTVVAGASGTNVLYMVTEGPSPRILFTDGRELFQANVISSDFNPHAAVFFGKLFMFGEQGFDTATKGACWTLGANGLSEELSFGDASSNQGIFTAQVEGEVILWGATGNAEVPTGIGVWDPRLDQSPDAALGYYVSNTISGASVNKVIGLAALAGKRYMGVAGVGVYGSTTPGAFLVRTGLYGADQRNIDKRWPVAEVHHSTLTAGQTITVKTRKDKAEAATTWDTSSTVGTKYKHMLSPADYRTPYLQGIVSGNAAGAALTLYDVAFGYIQTTTHADIKREWRLGIAVEGFDNPRFTTPSKGREYNRQGVAETRTSMQIKAELDALWNKEVCFEDIDGTEYTVLVKAAGYHPTAGWPSRFFPELDRYVDAAGIVQNLSLDYRLHLIEMRTG